MQKRARASKFDRWLQDKLDAKELEWKNTGWLQENLDGQKLDVKDGYNLCSATYDATPVEVTVASTVAAAVLRNAKQFVTPPIKASVPQEARRQEAKIERTEPAAQEARREESKIERREPAAQEPSRREPQIVRRDLLSLLGTWVSKDGIFSYDLSLDGSEDSTSSNHLCLDGCEEMGRSPLETPESSSGTDQDVMYTCSCAGGLSLSGFLRPAATDRNWSWEAELSNHSRVRLRCLEGNFMESVYLAPNSRDWTMPQLSRMAQYYVFYDANQNEHGYRYTHVNTFQDRSASQFPLIGLTAGWLPAEYVCKDGEHHLLENQSHQLQLMGTFYDPFDVSPPPAAVSKIQAVASDRPSCTFSDWDGELLVGSSESYAPFTNLARIAASCLRCSLSDLKTSGVFRGKLRKLPHAKRKIDLEWHESSSLKLPCRDGRPPRPLLSIVCVRWYDYWSDPNKTSSHDILNDGYFVDLFNGRFSVGELLRGEYEVYTIWIRNTGDLLKINVRNLRRQLRGENVVGWYFVYPSFVQDGHGYVKEQDFFAFCQAMERMEIRTGYPHEAHLYRYLCGKLWVPQMSLNRDFCVPATTRVHYSEFAQNPRNAVLRALTAIMRIRKTVWNREAVDFDNFKGIAKLGFSWGGCDVLPFQGLDSLIRNLNKLFRSSSSRQSPDCLVQEMIPGVVGEHRIICMHDKARKSVHKEILWVANFKNHELWSYQHELEELDVEEFEVASSMTISSRLVAHSIFQGDRAAQKDAENKAMRLADKWLRWYQTESNKPPSCTRLDFLVVHSNVAETEVWTCEVGECGASLCGVEVDGRNLAALNCAILRDDTNRFPMKLPDIIPRRSGRNNRQ